ncbi:MAG: DUF4105 domain-containing protein [Prevotella sp.]|nr:DUF4105 domain-containing protein [Prevotella sp.]
MKHFKIIFKVLLSLSAAFLASTARADQTFTAEYLDSVEVSLLTCQPHDEIYSLYGHTALRWHDLHDEETDIAFNWGVFNFKAPHFVARFVFGLTDYELGGFPFSIFQKEYRHYGSMVTEQVLNLTSDEKQQVYNSLCVNLLPENAVYRYNYFYNNCTTQARDIIERCINGKIEYAGGEDVTDSYRSTIHKMTERHPWARFGNDLLLGIKADMQTTRRQQEFLPDHLMYDFDHARICHDGQYRPLVKERRVVVPPGVQTVQHGFPLSPLQCGIILAGVAVILFAVQWRTRRIFLFWDVALMVVTGTFGIVLFLMLFSQHPTVSVNLQFLLLNPLPWLYLWPVVRHRPTRYWSITAVLAVLFLVGGCFQSYAAGIQAIALCLLLQCFLHLKSRKTA